MSFKKYFLPASYVLKKIKKEKALEDSKRKEELGLLLANLKYEILATKNDNLYFPKVINKTQTIEEIIKNKVSIARYGDGEFKAMLGEQMAFQDEIPEEMAKRLLDIFKEGSSDKFFVCIPDVFGDLSQYVPKCQTYWRIFLSKYRLKIYEYLNKTSLYYDAFLSRPYILFQDKSKCSNYFDLMKQIWNNQDIVIIEGKQSRLGIGNDLFSNVRSLKRILCPTKNAYDYYDEILENTKQLSKDTLILIALGPTATILAYDLYKAGFWAIDIGHTDVEYEWFKMGTQEKVNLKHKFVFEAGGKNVTECQDKNYLSSIIERIGV